MKLYHLKRLDEVDYDQYDSFVLRAEDETSARKLAESEASFDPKGVWLDKRLSTCVELLAEGEAGIVLGSFNAG